MIGLGVVIHQIVDHERGTVVGRHRRRTQHRRSLGSAEVGPRAAVHVLRRDVAFEDVLELRRHRAVHVEEVGHVDDVVDDLPAVGVHDRGVPVPVGPLVARGALDAGNGHPVRGWVALGVVPHEQHPVLLQGGPRRGASQSWHPPGVGHALAPPVATPAPVMEGAGNLVALDGAACEVATHVPAVAVEHVDPAVRAAEHDEPLTEGVDRVGRSVAEFLDEPEAVPAARESRRRSIRLDVPDSSSVSACSVMSGPSFRVRGAAPSIEPRMTTRG